ncbi:hypothetical protein H9P43_001026 [Blastocladiella emersonii ATCC 22665]|nr:hypothetical protein H9P43_001026 [Blastocladiella emersonii ATCC 22665]
MASSAAAAAPATARALGRPLGSRQVRAAFVDYFATQHGHRHVPSAPLIPHGDKSLLFTNAGMNQFKSHFLDPKAAPYPSAVTVQRCVRAGGKHNDLDNVGYTPRHHTFFEMLGNFSFGAYDKRAAIRLAWEFLTEVLQLPRDHLKVSVLDSDREAFEIWTAVMGLPAASVARLSAADNWWSMGDVGPCGPCTEIFWDHGSNDPNQWLEVWNVVFMEHYSRGGTGPNAQLDRLDVPCIDTGMGLERILSVLDGSFDNYATDVFAPLVAAVRGAATNPAADPALAKVIADHTKAALFLLTDGVIPSAVHRGYVLRKIIRRATRAASVLGVPTPLADLAAPHVLDMYPADAFPDLHARIGQTAEILRAEDAAFRALLARADRAVNQYVRGGTAPVDRVVPGDVAFDMHASLGFPLDVVEWLARDRGWSVDTVRAQELMEAHRIASGASPTGEATVDAPVPAEASAVKVAAPAAAAGTQFVGYDTLETEATVTAIVSTPDTAVETDAAKNKRTSGSKKSKSAAADPTLVVLVDRTPFYALGGGQVPDVGRVGVTSPDGTLTWYPATGAATPSGPGIAISRDPATGTFPSLAPGSRLTAEVDAATRHRTAAHHSATHLLHRALRDVLGPHVVQAGSHVDASRLTFDFTHTAALTAAQLIAVQSRANALAADDSATAITHEPIEAARARGAAMVFGDRYPDGDVRVVGIGPDTLELCAGTHVARARDAFPVIVLSDRSVAAGTRRVEAVAGLAAEQRIAAMQATLAAAASAGLGAEAAASPDAMRARVETMVRQTKDSARSVTSMVNAVASAELVVGATDHLAPNVRVEHVDPAMDPTYVRRRTAVVQDRLRRGEIVVMTYRTLVTAFVHTAGTGRVSARDVVQRVATALGGRGGGGGTVYLATAKVGGDDAGPGRATWNEVVCEALGM